MGALTCPAGKTAKGQNEMSKELYVRPPKYVKAFTTKINKRNWNYKGNGNPIENRPKTLVPAAANKKQELNNQTVDPIVQNENITPETTIQNEKTLSWPFLFLQNRLKSKGMSNLSELNYMNYIG